MPRLVQIEQRDLISSCCSSFPHFKRDGRAFFPLFSPAADVGDLTGAISPPHPPFSFSASFAYSTFEMTGSGSLREKERVDEVSS
ncbi:unnamed protein product [Hymenolepis diminuta]|uniref:Uncharacterized protein n=1 Tax=Hymenolepis diminuta TaxID=6216 RepID=A0A0R3SPF4_HYMDI|nr:unnamed protein product [Hymenolepis diminuta]